MSPRSVGGVMERPAAAVKRVPANRCSAPRVAGSPRNQRDLIAFNVGSPTGPVGADAAGSPRDCAWRRAFRPTCREPARQMIFTAQESDPLSHGVLSEGSVRMEGVADMDALPTGV